MTFRPPDVQHRRDLWTALAYLLAAVLLVALSL